MYNYIIFNPNQEKKPQGNKVVQYFKKLNSVTLRGLHAFALLKPYLTGYQKRTGQFLRALHAYSIYNFVFF